MQIKVNLGCHLKKKDGFIGVDNSVSKDVDIIHDLSKDLSIFHDNFIDEVFIPHLLDYILCDLEIFFEELHRVCKDRARVEISVAYDMNYNISFPEGRNFYLEVWFLNNLVFNRLFEISLVSFEYSPRANIILKMARLSLKESRRVIKNLVKNMTVVTKCVKGRRSGNNLYLDKDVYNFQNNKWELIRTTSLGSNFYEGLTILKTQGVFAFIRNLKNYFKEISLKIHEFTKLEGLTSLLKRVLNFIRRNLGKK